MLWNFFALGSASSIYDIYVYCTPHGHQSLSQLRINQILDNCGLDAAFKLDDAPEPESEAVPAPCAGLISSLRVGGDHTLLVHLLSTFGATTNVC